MSIFGELEPKRPLFYFEEICSIPHGSRETQMISNYIRDFAISKELKYVQDDCGNVIIYKKAHKDYESAEPVIIQGHIDMVCEKENDCSIDFTTEALTLELGERECNGSVKTVLFAKGTTLGADDGVAVCYMLALLEDEELRAPALECVFTVDEEIGMLGAAQLDYTLLKGRRMINIDNEEEGMILAGCAGGITATVHLPIKRRKECSSAEQNSAKRRCVLRIDGLTGGHSGEEIIKQRANANVLMGRTLNALKKACDIELVYISGGLKDNAIPRSCEAIIYVNDIDILTAKTQIADIEKIIRKEYANTDSGLYLEFSESELNIKVNEYSLENDSFECGIALLYTLPNGVQKMSEHTKGLVQTSLNMGILDTLEDEIIYSFSVRSSLGTEKKELTDRLECIAQVLGGYVAYEGDYPAWEYKEDSMLRPLMQDVYEQMFDSRPKTGTIHAGLECGIFSDKLEGLDCVSIGPNIHDIHTPLETMELDSFARCYDMVTAVLERLI